MHNCNCICRFVARRAREPLAGTAQLPAPGTAASPPPSTAPGRRGGPAHWSHPPSPDV